MSSIDANLFFDFNKIESLHPFLEKYTHPVFLYSKRVIENQFEQLKKNLPAKFKIFYAQKSNPHSEILKFLALLGAGCDTASKGEVVSALKAGFSSDKIMLTGPGKTKEELELAVENNLLSINVESLQEAELLNKICKEKNKIQNIFVRINPEFEAGETNRIIGGTGVSKFGIDIEQIPEFFEGIKSLKNINVNGIHIFNSSQILDWKRIFESTKNVIDAAMNISGKYKVDVRLIDLGGGFGIPYSPEENSLDVEQLGKSLDELIAKEPYKNFLENVKLIFEPGRFLSGQCGIYVTKVLYTKKSRGKNIAIIDGGVHHLLRPALIGQGHSIINLSALLEKRKREEKYIVAGPLCTSLDEFGNDLSISEIRQGDFLAVLNAGAYGFTESMPLFLSHPPAQEIFID